MKSNRYSEEKIIQVLKAGKAGHEDSRHLSGTWHP